MWPKIFLKKKKILGRKYLPDITINSFVYLHVIDQSKFLREVKTIILCVCNRVIRSSRQRTQVCLWFPLYTVWPTAMTAGIFIMIVKVKDKATKWSWESWFGGKGVALQKGLRVYVKEMKQATFLVDPSVLDGRLCFQRLNWNLYLGNLKAGTDHIACEFF